MISCSRPALTHSGWKPMSAGSSPNKRAISAGCDSTSRDVDGRGAQRPVIAVGGHRDDAGAHLEAELVAAEPERAAHVRGAERRMAGERHFVGGREDAHQRRGALGRQDERGLRQVHLARQRLHGGGVEPTAVFEHAQGIAGEPRAAGGEHVENAVA